MKKIINYILLLSCTTGAVAQEFTAKSMIPVTEQDKMYRILITPEIRSYSDRNLSDLRVYNSQKKEIPYFINDDHRLLTVQKGKFKEYPIIAKGSIADTSSYSIVENTSDASIKQIGLFIANSDVTKTYNISGSNDLKEWYGLVNQQKLYDLYSHKTTSTSVYKEVSIPLSSYRYLKIEFDDKKTLPIQVLKIGTYFDYTVSVRFDEVKANDYTVKELSKEKKTQLHFKFERPQTIDQIAFTITAPALYNRTARILLNKTRKVKKRTEVYQEVYSTFELNSNNLNHIDFPRLFEKEFTIEIENKDNAPLSIASAKLMQIPAYIITELKAGEQYTIQTGNPKLTAPSYDLGYFKNSIPKDLSILKPTKVIESKTVSKTMPSPFWQQPWFLWICIGIGAITTVYFSVSLLKDMKK